MVHWQLVKPTRTRREAELIQRAYKRAHPTTKTRVRATKEFYGYHFVVEYESTKAGYLFEF